MLLEISIENLPKEMKFLKKMIMEGNYTEAEAILNGLSGNIEKGEYEKLLFELKKQEFLEMCEQKVSKKEGIR